MMKYACRYGLRDSPYPIYSVYILDLCDHMALRSVPSPPARKESPPPKEWGHPFPGLPGEYLKLLVLNFKRRVSMGFLVFGIYLVSLS